MSSKLAQRSIVALLVGVVEFFLVFRVLKNMVAWYGEDLGSLLSIGILFPVIVAMWVILTFMLYSPKLSARELGVLLAAMLVGFIYDPLLVFGDISLGIFATAAGYLIGYKKD